MSIFHWSGSRRTTSDKKAPTKGAVEKYALVRAVPIRLSDMIKQTRLKPYPRKPIASAVAAFLSDGIGCPTNKARPALTLPEVSPFIAARTGASRDGTWFVKLLSTAQEPHAPAMKRMPTQFALNVP